MKIRFLPDWKPLAALSALFLTLNACAPKPTATPFVPPPQPAPIIVITPTTAIVISPTSIPAILPATPTPPCTDALTYIRDLTVPDDTLVAPGQSIDKQWLIANSGTCNWDSGYRLKLAGGSNMGAASEQALYPARAGTQATLHIIFTAPSEPGTYRSEWQAVNPGGAAFGDSIYIQITVSP